MFVVFACINTTATTFANIDFENDFPKLVTYFQINGKKLAQ